MKGGFFVWFEARTVEVRRWEPVDEDFAELPSGEVKDPRSPEHCSSVSFRFLLTHRTSWVFLGRAALQGGRCPAVRQADRALPIRHAQGLAAAGRRARAGGAAEPRSELTTSSLALSHSGRCVRWHGSHIAQEDDALTLEGHVSSGSYTGVALGRPIWVPDDAVVGVGGARAEDQEEILRADPRLRASSSAVGGGGSSGAAAAAGGSPGVRFSVLPSRPRERVMMG